MTRYSSKDYPEESMALAYLESKDAVKQLVYFSEKFGIFVHRILSGEI